MGPEVCLWIIHEGWERKKNRQFGFVGRECQMQKWACWLWWVCSITGLVRGGFNLFCRALLALRTSLQCNTDLWDRTALKASFNTLAVTHSVRLMVFTAWVVVVWRNDWIVLRVVCVVWRRGLWWFISSAFGHIWRSQLQVNQTSATAILDIRAFHTD